MPRRKIYRNIPLPLELVENLDKLRKELNIKTWEELFIHLLSIYRECIAFKLKQKIHGLMCRELRESKASLAGWIKLLLSRLSTADEIESAIKYLIKADKEDEYVVDIDRCRE